MNTTFNFFPEKIVDEAVAIDPRFPGKGSGHDEDAKVAFSRAGGISMSGMKLGFIDDVEPRRTKLHHQLFTKTLGNGHSVLLSLTIDTTYQM